MRLFTESDLERVRRCAPLPPEDGGRAEAQRERIAAFPGRETAHRRVKCVAGCGAMLAHEGMCARCDGECGAMESAALAEANTNGRPWWRARRGR